MFLDINNLDFKDYTLSERKVYPYYLMLQIFERFENTEHGLENFIDEKKKELIDFYYLLDLNEKQVFITAIEMQLNQKLSSYELKLLCYFIQEKEKEKPLNEYPEFYIDLVSYQQKISLDTNLITRYFPEYIRKGIHGILNETNQMQIVANENYKYRFFKETINKLNIVISEMNKGNLKPFDIRNSGQINSNTQTPTEQKEDEPKQVSFKGLFYDQKNSEIILNILKELKIINANNEYIGKNKGMFPKILRVLSNLENKKIIKPLTDIEYKNALNNKITNLNLSKDASEWRKDYKRIEKNNIELEIRSLFSQFSQTGK